MGRTPIWNPINKFGQPKEAEYKIRRVRKNETLAGVDATYGVALHHPDGQGLWEVSGIAGSAGCYAFSSGHSLAPAMFEPGQKFGFRLPNEYKNLEVTPEGMLLGWTVIIEPIFETE